MGKQAATSLSVLLWAFTACSSANLTNNYSSSLNYAQVTKVSAIEQTENTWCFHTQVRHNDQGWNHYADHWEVIDLNGNVLGQRPLAHPHDNEQPFTRSQCGIKIPNRIKEVVVRAKCNHHGYEGKQVLVNLMQAKGDHFSVKRRQ
ncbi:hypothetical protein EYS14_11350 [Alteromonadaceae bacterium M269]|nr:hypothetical protein EYS14_11350 [Alteromonadaceae bacterium M269]